MLLALADASPRPFASSHVPARRHGWPRDAGHAITTRPTGACLPPVTLFRPCARLLVGSFSWPDQNLRMPRRWLPDGLLCPHTTKRKHKRESKEQRFHHGPRMGSIEEMDSRVKTAPPTRFGRRFSKRCRPATVSNGRNNGFRDRCRDITSERQTIRPERVSVSRTKPIAFQRKASSRPSRRIPSNLTTAYSRVRAPA